MKQAIAVLIATVINGIVLGGSLCALQYELGAMVHHPWSLWPFYATREVGVILLSSWVIKVLFLQCLHHVNEMEENDEHGAE